MVNMNNLDQRARNVLLFASAFGCIRTVQLKKILEVDETRPVSKVISFLRKDRYVAMKDDIVFPFPANNKMDWEMIDCIWVAADKAKNEDGTYELDALANSFSNKPVNIVMNCRKDNITYNIVALTEGNIDSKMPFIIERFKSEHKGRDIKKIKNIQYLFVIKDKSIAPLIAEYDIPMPNKIALLFPDEETGFVSKIRYMSKK